MADIGEVATRKLAGIPVWGWAAGVGGIIILYAYYRARNASATTTATTTTTTTPDTSSLDSQVAGNGYLPSSPYPVTEPVTTGGTSAQSTAFASTADWENYVLTHATTSSPTGVIAAIDDWLNGNPLSYNERSIVDNVVKAYGPPPGYDNNTPQKLVAGSSKPPVVTQATGGTGTGKATTTSKVPTHS